MKQYEKIIAVSMLLAFLSLPGFAADNQKSHIQHHPEGQQQAAAGGWIRTRMVTTTDNDSGSYGDVFDT
jgi:hypothetical protein